ncbi:MAG: FHA domain-containing protein [Planctomycetota bacterium]
MSKFLKIYYYALFGAFGGLLSWFISAELELFLDFGKWRTLFIGGLLGFWIGGFTAIADPLLSRSFLRAGHNFVLGALIGSLGGMIGLSLGEFYFQKMGGGSLIRVIGYGILGLFLGISQSKVGDSPLAKGITGGTLGGILGGLFLEYTLSQGSEYVAQATALSFTVLGACIGAFMVLVATMLMSAWLEVKNGKMQGKVYDLTKFVYSFKQKYSEAIIGSDELKSDIYLLGDTSIDAHHASISRQAERHILKDLGSKRGTFVRGASIQEHILKDGDILQVGNTSVLYREKRKAIS